MTESDPANPVEHFLTHFPAPVSALAAAARVLIRDVMPAVVEMVDEPAHMLGYGLDRTYKGAVCGIVLYSAYINIMLAHGASLPDPHGLLRGTGKKARHLRIAAVEQLSAPGVRELLQAALHAAQG